jgi:uncharacterized membrane protein YphA (DoxX/SURF4 family)
MSGALSEYNTGRPGWRFRLLVTRAPGWSNLVRLLVGLSVLLPEGVQKLAFADVLGVASHRFANIGIPYPELMGSFVSVVEIVCGVMLVGALYLLIEGAGAWSLDAMLARDSGPLISAGEL